MVAISDHLLLKGVNTNLVGIFDGVQIGIFGPSLYARYRFHLSIMFSYCFQSILDSSAFSLYTNIFMYHVRLLDHDKHLVKIS